VDGLSVNACDHCGLPLIPGAITENDQGRFCCPGCSMAHDLVAGMGLDKYYRTRQLDDTIRPLKPDDSQLDLDFSLHAKTDGEGAAQNSEMSLVIEGYQCAACGWLIEQVLARDDRVTSARVNMTTQRLRLVWHGPAELAGNIVEPVLKLGYRLFPYDAELVEQSRAARDRELLKAMAVAGFAAANVMLLSVSVWAGYSQGMGPATRDLMHWISALIALPAIVYAGQPFFRSGLSVLARGRVNMDVPISLAVVITAAMSLYLTATGARYAYFDSAVGLLFFLLIGRYLDQRARSRARSSAAHLLALSTRTVTVLEADGSRRTCRPEDVAPGKTVIVAAGERIGVDGEVLRGQSDIDQSLLTGESLPVAVRPGSGVNAGTLNVGQPLEVRATATGEATALAEIVRLMEQAEHGKAAYVDLAERVARLYAPVVHVMGAATFIGWMVVGAGWEQALLNGVAVLIITCPCALALAVPAAQVAAASRLMRRGVLLKTATALERLAQVDTIVFDKTGTLTEGRPVLVNDPSGEDLSIAASLAVHSRHSLAKAVVTAAGALSCEVVQLSDVREVSGGGLSARSSGVEVRLGSRAFCGVDSAGEADGPEMWLRVGDDAPAQFVFADELRSDAAEVIGALTAQGYDIRILSGDRPETVARVAAELGVTDYQGGVDPAGKHQYLHQVSQAGRRVLMVGDGLNDAPSLAAAFVSLSPSSAADISQTASDAVFQGGRLAPVREILQTSRRARRIIAQNLGFSLTYNVVTIPFAVAGLVTPLFAAVAMSTSSIVVMVNALRLGGRR